MAGKKENIKALFTNTRSRVIIIFTIILLVVAVLVGISQFYKAGDKGKLVSGVSNAPVNIRSIPGALDPTVQYAKLQEAQNVDQAKAALKTGSSAIPTIIRSQTMGSGVGAIGSEGGEGGVGFSALTREDNEGVVRSEWIQQLQNSSCSKETMAQVVNEGAKLADIKSACSCIQLKDNGYNLTDLQQVCSCPELKAAGINARQLKDIGYTTERLLACGYDACALRSAGYSAQEMKDGGYSDGELKGAGFTSAEIAKASGLPDGMAEADVRKAGCEARALAQLKSAGVSASAIRRITGCSATQLKAAGFSAQDLRDAGFTAADLKNAGFTPQQLAQAGFSARDLLNAGFTPNDLVGAGYSPADILAAESHLPPGITPEDVRKAGCSPEVIKNQRLAGVSAKLIKQYAGCSVQALKAAGFTKEDLINAGFTPEQIAAEITSPDTESTKGVSDELVQQAGCSPEKLKTLFAQGVSAKRIHKLNGCSPDQLKAAGYDAKALLEAEFTPQELLAAGFTPKQLSDAGISPAAYIAAGRQGGCSVESLRAARASGMSASTIRQTLGCTAAAMKAAGFTGAELKAAGFTAAELKNAGLSAAELKAAGFSAKDLKDAGFSAEELKDAGFTPRQLKEAGFSATNLKAAGLNANQLKAAGFTAKELKDAGFNADQLKAAGFSAKELKDAGFTAGELKSVGFSSAELTAAGFTEAQVGTAASLPLPETTQIVGLATVDKVPGVPSNLPAIPGSQVMLAPTPAQQIAAADAASAKQLNAIRKRQNKQQTDQKYQQKIQQRTSEMMSAANQSLQNWRKVSTQVYIAGTADTKKTTVVATSTQPGGPGQPVAVINNTTISNNKVLIKTGDILFATIDTSIDSDEPGPILATIVSGKLRGAKLIGSFNLPPNADKMVITFNTMSVPGASKSTSISAFAIDADTARTALSSATNHHYLSRYGSLFAASFLEGFGNAFQSANTTVTIGGTGGGDNTTITNGVGRSALENAVIGLATVGKNWGQVAQQNFNRPTTVQVYSGTGIGVLFTQDLTSL